MKNLITQVSGMETDYKAQICPKDDHFKHLQGFPGGAAVENLPTNTGDTGSSPDMG